MPKRTNYYQKLILHLHREFESELVTIKESKMLWDSASKQNREVDIYIEKINDPDFITVGIECTATKRKVSLPKLEQLFQKFLNLGIGKLIVVSRHGFTKSAKNFSKNKEFELITFNDALEMSWPEWISSFKDSFIRHVTTSISNIEMLIENSSNKIFINSEDVYVVDNEMKKLLIHDFIESRVNDDYRYYAEFKNTRRVDWSFNPKLTIEDKNGTLAETGTISFLCKSYEQKANFQYGEYNDKAVVFSAISNPNYLEALSVVATPSDVVSSDGEPKFVLTINIDRG